MEEEEIKELVSAITGVRLMLDSRKFEDADDSLAEVQTDLLKQLTNLDKE